MQGLVCKPWEVSGLLDGSITHLVRPVVPQPPNDQTTKLCCVRDGEPFYFWIAENGHWDPFTAETFRCPFPAVGERFYVQEEYGIAELDYPGKPSEIWYKANFSPAYGTWETPTFPGSVTKRYEGRWEKAEQMTQEFSRCKPEVVSVRVGRLQDVSIKWNGVLSSKMPDSKLRRDYVSGELDDTPESLASVLMDTLAPFVNEEAWRQKFIQQWNADNPELPWESNPWVWLGGVKV